MAEYTLYLGDCLEYIKTMPSKSVDAVITDPPYGVGIEYSVYSDTDENWESMFISLIPEIKRISKMAVLPCCQIRKLPFIYSRFPPDWLICWYKGSTGARAFIGFNDWEPLLVYGKRDGVQMHDYFSCPPENKSNIIGHPCPKPIRWGTWLVSRMTQEKDIVFDPFMGSGTTGVACMQLGRNFIGCEIDSGYFEIAKKRIAQAAAQPLLITET